jgi:hypothetical protein
MPRSHEAPESRPEWSVFEGQFDSTLLEGAAFHDKIEEPLEVFNKNIESWVPQTVRERQLSAALLAHGFSIVSPEIAADETIQKQISLSAQTAIHYCFKLSDKQLMGGLKEAAAEALEGRDEEDLPIVKYIEFLAGKMVISRDMRVLMRGGVRSFIIMEGSGDLPQPPQR